MAIEAFQDRKDHRIWRVGSRTQNGDYVYRQEDPVYKNEAEAKTAADRINKSLENNRMWN